MTGIAALGSAIVLGTAFACGVALLVGMIPAWSAPTLTRRIAPYVRDIADPAGLTPLTPQPVDVRAALGRSVRAVLERTGSAAAIQRRLRHAGWTMDATSYRTRQAVWILIGTVVGAVGGAVGMLAGAVPLAPVALAGVGALAGALGCDVLLTRAVRRRAQRLQDELPTVLEFLALCLSAGEGLRDALARVSEVGAGELVAELGEAVRAARAGTPVADALGALAARVHVAGVSRAVDHLVAGLERGAPLADVLHAQASDAREDAKRALLEQAGKKEVSMLFPLVFLVLPLSVLFAIYPGVVMLRLGAP